MTLSSHCEWISCVSVVISLRLQLNFIIYRTREMLSTSFLEKDSSVFVRGAVGGCEWGCEIAFTWAALCPLFSFVEIPCHFIPIILCLNPFYPSLVSFPFFSFTLSSPPSFPAPYVCVSPSLYCPFFFPHRFPPFLPTHPSLACPLSFSQTSSTCLCYKMDGLQKWNDKSKGITESGWGRVVAF